MPCVPVGGTELFWVAGLLLVGTTVAWDRPDEVRDAILRRSPAADLLAELLDVPRDPDAFARAQRRVAAALGFRDADPARAERGGHAVRRSDSGRGGTISSRSSSVRSAWRARWRRTFTAFGLIESRSATSWVSRSSRSRSWRTTR
jgi:hypothetical protein